MSSMPLINSFQISSCVQERPKVYFHGLNQKHARYKVIECLATCLQEEEQPCCSKYATGACLVCDYVASAYLFAIKGTLGSLLPSVLLTFYSQMSISKYQGLVGYLVLTQVAEFGYVNWSLWWLHHSGCTGSPLIKPT